MRSALYLTNLENLKWFMLKLHPILLTVSIIKSVYIPIIYTFSLLLIYMCMKVTTKMSS